MVLRITFAVLALFCVIPASAGPLYDVLPDTALVSVYMHEPGRALPRKLIDPVLRRALPRPADADRFARLLSRLPGPLLLGVIHQPGGSAHDQALIVAADVRDVAPIDALVRDIAAPLIGDLMKTPLSLDATAPIRRILRDDATVFEYALRDGRLFGSTHRGVVSDWLRGDYPKKKWVSDGGIRQWIGSLPPQPLLRVLFNPVPLIRDIPRPRHNSWDALAMQVLSPEDVRAIGGDLTWDRESIALDVSVVLAESSGGIARAFTVAPQPSRTLGIFPADFTAIGRIGWPSAAALINGAYAVLDRVDPEIGAEYRDELVDFKKETGVDFDADLAANLVGEIAFGVRINFTRPNPIAWAVACPLADARRFSARLDALIKHFDISTARQNAGGIEVQTSALTFPFAFAIAADRLLIADSPATLGEVASPAPADAVARPRSASLDHCLSRLAAVNNACLLVNLESLGRSLGPLAAALGRNKALLTTGSIGLALARRSGTAHARLLWTISSPARSNRGKSGAASPEAPGDDAPQPIDLAASVLAGLMDSADAAQIQAQRTVSAANMRQVGQGLYIYAQDHKDQFPTDLAELVRLGLAAPHMLSNTYDGTGPTGADDVAEKCGYIYRAGLTTRSDPTEIILAERSIGDREGAHVLFVDGHVEFVRGPEARQIIEQIQRGEKSIRRQP